ncbi:MAG: glutathione S-transferase family protein [Paracoccaceae bacterium]|nr:MAG: glutathione S-transferase family protein [Paracoccaceae bacterium]
MAGYQLYGYAGSGSAAVELALLAGGIAHKRVDLDPAAGDLTNPDFLAINPRGQVPALVLPDGSVVTELPAILSHLADANPGSGLAPPPGSPLRAQHDRWMAFTHANIYEAVLRVYYTDRYTTDPAGVPGIKAAAEAYVFRHLALLEDAVGAGPFLLGSGPMGVDFLIWVILTWLDRDQVSATAPGLLAMADALSAAPNLAETAKRHL